MKPALSAWMASLKALLPSERDAVLARLGRHDEATLPQGRVPDGRVSDLTRMMTPLEVRRLHDAGHEIGAHTHTHPILPPIDDAALEREVRTPAQQLRSLLGSFVPGFCYPNGDHDARVVEAVRDAGYAYACTTIRGSNARGEDPYRLRRVDMNPARVTGARGSHDEAALRAEVALYHRGAP